MNTFKEKIQNILSFENFIKAAFALLILFIPMQYRYHKWVKPLAKLLAKEGAALPLYFEKMVFYCISDVFILFIIIAILFRRGMLWKESFWGGRAKYLSLFFLISFTSLLLSKNSDYFLQYFRLGQLFWVGLLFFLISSGVLIKESKKAIQAFFALFCASSLFQCFVAIYQYFTQHALGLKKLGEMNLGSPNLVPSSLMMHDGSLWLFDHVFFPGQAKVLARAYGTLPDPNILGGVLCVAILGLFYFFLKARRRYQKALLSLAIAVECFSLFITYSRSAYFGLIIGSAVFMGLEMMQLFQKKGSDEFLVKKKGLEHLFFVVTASVSLSFLLLYPQILARGGYVNYKNTAAQGADEERKVYQNVAIDTIKDNILTGVGYNNYVLEMKEYSKEKLPEEFSHPVHNIFLLIASETGILGLISFCAFVFGCGLSLLKKGSSSEKNILLSAYLVLGFIACCSHYLLTWQQGKLMLFIILGLMALHAKKERKTYSLLSEDVSEVTI